LGGGEYNKIGLLCAVLWATGGGGATRVVVGIFGGTPHLRRPLRRAAVYVAPHHTLRTGGVSRIARCLVPSHPVAEHCGESHNRLGRHIWPGCAHRRERLRYRAR